MRRIAAAVAACLLAAACHGGRPRPTRLAAALDSLTPGLRFGDNAATVKQKLPGFSLKATRTFDTTLDNPWLGSTQMSLAFEGAITSILGAPPPPQAGLEAVVLTVATDSEFRRTAAALERWLGARADTACSGSSEGHWAVLVWRPDSTELLIATPPVPGVAPGYVQLATTALASKRLAAPPLVKCAPAAAGAAAPAAPPAASRRRSPQGR